MGRRPKDHGARGVHRSAAAGARGAHGMHDELLRGQQPAVRAGHREERLLGLARPGAGHGNSGEGGRGAEQGCEATC